jgi:hypothetical protein
MSTNLSLRILGTWVDTTVHNSVEFTANGNAVLNYGGYSVSGTYKLIGNNEVTLNLGSSPGPQNSIFSANTWQYGISGDTMFVEANNSSDIFILNGSANTIISFPDLNLQAAVRKAINKPTGNIYLSDLEGITQLQAVQSNINDLNGIEYCTNLITLELPFNQISDISLLAFLPSLTNIELNDNEISDISPLASLSKLSEIDLSHNQIGDISALASLPKINMVNLDDNLINDISPLLTNPGMSDGVHILLSNNQLSQTSLNKYIPELESKGVQFTCPDPSLIW